MSSRFTIPDDIMDRERSRVAVEGMCHEIREAYLDHYREILREHAEAAIEEAVNKLNDTIERVDSHFDYRYNRPRVLIVFKGERPDVSV